MDNFLGALLITLAVFIGVFLLLREFWCWYFKINERIQLQKALLAAVREMNPTPAQGSDSSAATRYAAGQITRDEYLAATRAK